MRAKRVLVFFIFASLAALIAWTSVDPIWDRCHRAGEPRSRCAGWPRCGATRAPPAADVDAARRPRSSGRRPACSRCPSICSRRRTSTRIGRTGSTSATTAATIRASSTAMWDRAAHRPQAAGIGVVGRLQRRLAARAHREPLPLQDGEGTLRGAAGAGEVEGRTDRLHEGDGARLGWLLPARRAGRSRLRVDLGRHAGADGPVAAHAGISEAHGADRLPRGGHQRAAVERLVLLARRIHPLVVAALAGGKLPAHDDARGRSSSCRASPTTSCVR